MRATVTGAPTRISICHCHACQQRTGSFFAAQARWPRERAVLEGQSSVWRRTGDEGHAMDFHFCPICGTTVWYIAVDRPEVVAIAVGAFADETFPMATVSVYDNRRRPWIALPPEIERD
jgi:hypothetical protein